VSSTNLISDPFLEKNYVLRDGIYINLNQPIDSKGFQDAYLDVRDKEGRLYDINTLQLLPGVAENHPLAHEWGIRKRSAEKFAAYLTSKNKDLKVLEIGCGNGWLTNYLAKRLPDSQFIGMDVNWAELLMAEEAFTDAKNINWIYDEISKQESLPKQYFDIVYFAAAIQYFPNLKDLFSKVSKYLAAGGEIHILDSPFYSNKQAKKATQRSLDYYAKSAPEMANYYFHQTLKNLNRSGFKIKKMNATPPFSFLKKLDKKGLWDYFGWYCLTKP